MSNPRRGLRGLLGRLLGGHAHDAAPPARPSDPAIARGHEFRDVSAGNILVTVFALFATLLVTMLIVWGLFTLLQNNRRTAQLPQSPLAATPVVPPEPRLQPDPPAAYQADRQVQLEQLEQYQWVDQGQGTVRIPIERAIDLLAERGLPTTVPVTETVTPEMAATETATP